LPLGARPVLAAELPVAHDARRRFQYRVAAPNLEPLDPAEVDVLHQFDQPPPGRGKVALRDRTVHRLLLAPEAQKRTPRGSARRKAPSRGVCAAPLCSRAAGYWLAGPCLRIPGVTKFETMSHGVKQMADRPHKSQSTSVSGR